MKASASHDARGQNGFVAWLEERLPVREFIQSQLTDYYAPNNLRARVR